MGTLLEKLNKLDDARNRRDERIRYATAVRNILLNEGISDREIDRWLSSRQPLFQGRRPNEMIACGHGSAVFKEIELVIREEASRAVGAHISPAYRGA